MLPHDFLLAVVRGEVIDGHAPTFDERLTAARAAAPYFAPRLASVDVVAEHRTSVAEFSDAELYAMLAETPEGKAIIAARGDAVDDGSGRPAWAQVARKIEH